MMVQLLVWQLNATNRLRNSKSKSKVMILLSDGSNNAGELDPITAADLANQFDIKIYTIGATTDQSLTYIPGVGRMINEIDEKTLKEIAKETVENILEQKIKICYQKYTHK